MSSSKSYVIAQYRDVTRKLGGDWGNESYSNLIEAIRLKFDISDKIQIDIKVHDKSNNKYFLIDEDEMVEIPSDGMIKITKSNRKRPKKKAKPKPVIPKLSKEDANKLRNEWTINSMVELYSDSNAKWIGGKIFAIITDSEGEWLRIRYLGDREKEIQRFSKFIRPLIPPNYKPNITADPIPNANVKEEDEKKQSFNVSAEEFIPSPIPMKTEQKSPELPPLPTYTAAVKVEEKEKAASISSDAIVKKIEDVVSFVEEAKNEKKEEVKEEKEKPAAYDRQKINKVYVNNKKYKWRIKQPQIQKGQYRMVKGFGYGKKGRQTIEKIVSYNQYRNYKKPQNNKRRASQYVDYGYGYERYPPPPPEQGYGIRGTDANGKIIENVCWQFNTMIGCRRGQQCQWEHKYVASAGKNAFATSRCWQFNTFTGCPKGVYCPWNHF